VREAEAEKRKAAAAEGAGQGWRKAAASATAAGKPPNMGMALPGMGGPGADKAMQVCGAAAEGPVLTLCLNLSCHTACRGVDAADDQGGQGEKGVSTAVVP